MIHYSELMIGDYVLVKGQIRRVEAITKKKIGYHTKENETRLYYAYFRDVEAIYPCEFATNTVGGETTVLFRHLGFSDFVPCFVTDNDVIFNPKSGFIENVDGEHFYIHSLPVHEIQHRLKILFQGKKRSKKFNGMK